MIEDIIKCGKNCSPGTSGTPKAAWYYGGGPAADYVEKLTDDFFLGNDIPDGVNDLLFVSLPSLLEVLPLKLEKRSSNTLLKHALSH